MMTGDIDFLALTGRKNSDLFLYDEKTQIYLSSSMKEAFFNLREGALKEGIDLQIASGHRSYERQLAIWNAKASGQRKLRDREENPVDFDSSTPDQILSAILSWSAIPGASRHHWGTEIDIYDQNVKMKSQVSLTLEECATDFSRLYDWIDANLESYPFHRPYDQDLGGVAREPWHLSFTPKSSKYQSAYTFEVFQKNVKQSTMSFKDLILSQAKTIYEQYVLNVAPY